MMRLLILGGIGEAVKLARRLAPFHVVTYSIAGKGRAPDLSCAVRVGGFGGSEGLAAFLRDHRIELLIDATHPYAAQISRNAAQAARAAGVPLWAYRRPAWQPQLGDGWRSVADWAEIMTALQEFKRPFFTIGLEPLRHVATIPPEQYWLVRCLAADPPVSPRLTVLCAAGPFSLEQESALLRDYQIDALAAKNSGGGAVAAKLAAARQLSIPVVLLERPVLPAAEREFAEVKRLAAELAIFSSDRYYTLSTTVDLKITTRRTRMDVGALFDQLLQSGRELASKAQTMAEQKLNIPSEGPEREAALAGMGKGATIAGAAALLLGTSAGRSLTGVAVKLGSLAAVSGLAYKAFQDWQAKKEGAPVVDPGPAANTLSGPHLEQRSLALLRAMLAAAKADGHIDEQEQGRIDAYLQKLGLDPEALHFVKNELAKPLNVKEVAAGADSPAAAAEIYLTSLLAIDIDSDQERAYLDDLAKELKLPPELVSELLDQAKA